MKPQFVAWAIRAAILLFGAGIVLALGIALGQCLYWLRFGRWRDWTASADAHPSAAGAQWKGVRILLDWLLLAPVELATFIAGLSLVAFYIAARMSSRR